MRGIISYTGWSHAPDFNRSALSADDNPFAEPKQLRTGKMSVNLPTDEWLCKKPDKLNITLVEDHHSRGSEAGGLQCDQFNKKTQFTEQVVRSSY